MSELGEPVSPPAEVSEPVEHITEDMSGQTRTINFSS